MKHSMQRDAILEELRSLTCHPTAEELHGRLKCAMPHLSLATVYRNLEQFAAAGLIRKLDCGGTLKRFDGNVEDHPHLRCSSCGRVSDVKNSEIDRLQNELQALLPGLDFFGISIEFSGRCRTCQKNVEEEVLV